MKSKNKKSLANFIYITIFTVFIAVADKYSFPYLLEKTKNKLIANLIMIAFLILAGLIIYFVYKKALVYFLNRQKEEKPPFN